MLEYPEKHMTVLCGHTHSSGQAQILNNLEVLTGKSSYGEPELQQIVECGDDIVQIAEKSPGICGVADGKSCGVREVARHLEARGIKASIPTISRDIQALWGPLGSSGVGL